MIIQLHICSISLQTISNIVKGNKFTSIQWLCVNTPACTHTLHVSHKSTCVHVCVHACTCMHTHAHVHTYTYMYAYTCTHIHTHACIHIHTRTHIHACIHMHTRTHIHTRYMCARVRMHVDTCKYLKLANNIISLNREMSPSLIPIN